jgi:alpha-tubulin suppressor-like RCC1 family protein
MSKEIDIYNQKLYKKYKKKYLSLKNQNAGAGKIYFIIKLKDNFEIFSNYNSTFILKDKKIFASGNNEYGQLGLGDESKKNTFTEVPLLPDNKVAKKVVAGLYHTMILTEDGEVFACGENKEGQLGLGDNVDRNTFEKVPPLPEDKVVKQVVVGSFHTMILTEDGMVFACGYNALGQLGLGNLDKINTFTKVSILHDDYKVAKLVAGNNHTMILTENGKVFACGNNTYGQLGLEDTENKNTFTAVPPLLNNKVAKQVVAGSDYTMILANDGTVFACGNNLHGELGLLDNNIRITFTTVSPLPKGKVAKQVVAGSNHTMILAEDGTVFACGYNYYKQLGIMKYKNTSFTAVELPEGKVAKKVIAGSNHTIIITKDNTVFGCGRNNDGQLGQGDKSKFYNLEQINLNDLN